MTRNVKDLEQNAERFWPPKLSKLEQASSVIPRLIESQEKFIGILYVADGSPTAWKDVLTATAGMPGNLFVKHLMVLSDLPGEKLQRYKTNLASFFPSGVMTYRWRGKRHRHNFHSFLSKRSWTNGQLSVDGAGLAKPQALEPIHEDVAMLLIHGGNSVDPGIPGEITDKCTVGSMLGCKKDLDSFVRQRYIYVSRITGGVTANTMGQLCQTYARERLQSSLKGWDLTRKTIPGISHNAGRTDMSFDIVAQSPSGKCCAIEVSFQVTTNSTIERKAGQAEARQRLLHKHGHRIAYVIDGAGNFQRQSALADICANSDCTVSFRDDELDKLAAYLKKL